jgi:hypothetical protein
VPSPSIFEMGTLRGSPNPPAMSSARQSRATHDAINDHLPLPLAGEGRGEGKPLSGDARPGQGPRESKPLKLALALFALLVGGCSMSKWTVKPHQRELLADRIMQLDADAQERSAEEHVLANREGAIGGTGTSGGGCGCN